MYLEKRVAEDVDGKGVLRETEGVFWTVLLAAVRAARIKCVPKRIPDRPNICTRLTQDKLRPHPQSPVTVNFYVTVTLYHAIIGWRRWMGGWMSGWGCVQMCAGVVMCGGGISNQNF